MTHDNFLEKDIYKIQKKSTISVHAMKTFYFHNIGEIFLRDKTTSQTLKSGFKTLFTTKQLEAQKRKWLNL